MYLSKKKFLKRTKNEIERMQKCTTDYSFSVIFGIRKYPDLRSFQIDWNVGIRRNGSFVRREVWGLHIPGDVVSRCRTRGMHREIHCDEYLRLRLRKSKAIRFKRREVRTRHAISPYRFSRERPRIWPSGYFFLRNMLIIRAPVTFLYYIGPRYVISRRKDGRRKFIISSTVTTCYLCPAVWFSGFSKSPREATLATRRVLLFS